MLRTETVNECISTKKHLQKQTNYHVMLSQKEKRKKKTKTHRIQNLQIV